MARAKKGQPTGAVAVSGLGLVVSLEHFLSNCADALKDAFKARVRSMDVKSKRGDLYYYVVDPVDYADPSKGDAAPVPVSTVPGVPQGSWIAIEPDLRELAKKAFWSTSV